MPININLKYFLIITLLVHSTISLAQKRDTVMISASTIRTAKLSEGRRQYLVYFKKGIDSSRTKARFLKRNPAFSVYMVGHTDNTGDFTKNLILSKERAATVASELVNTSQLVAQGVGGALPPFLAIRRS